MNKLLVIILVCIFAYSSNAEGQKGIRFFEGSWEEAKTESKKTGKPIFVDFYAEWCGPCKMMGPAFGEAARELEPHVRFVKLSTETEPILAKQWNIRSIPTMVLVIDGKEKARQSGAMSADDIKCWVRTNI